MTIQSAIRILISKLYADNHITFNKYKEWWESTVTING